MTPFPLTPQRIARFWQKVLIPSDPDACWIWSSRTRKGYATFKCESAGKRYCFSASRLSFILAHGHNPTHSFICHHCDNPRCVNPAHLFAGSRSDNAQDMLRKNRGNYSNCHPPRNCKLSDAQVLEIRRLYAQGNISTRQLAKLFPTSRENVGAIIRRHLWKHLPAPQGP